MNVSMSNVSLVLDGLNDLIVCSTSVSVTLSRVKTGSVAFIVQVLILLSGKDWAIFLCVFY